MHTHSRFDMLWWVSALNDEEVLRWKELNMFESPVQIVDLTLRSRMSDDESSMSMNSMMAVEILTSWSTDK